jgi:hypothetical protein
MLRITEKWRKGMIADDRDERRYYRCWFMDVDHQTTIIMTVQLTTR